MPDDSRANRSGITAEITLVEAGPRARLSTLLRDASAPAIAAGFIAVLISLAGPLLIYLQSAGAMGVSAADFSSWIMAICGAAGLASLALSLALRAPVLVAWSAPGCVLLGTVGPTLTMPEVVGAYIVTALLILAVGLTGLFDRLVRLVPRAVAAGMMAGILFRFGAGALGGLQTAPATVGAMLLAFVVLSAATPRYALIWLLMITLGLTFAKGDAAAGAGLVLARPHLVWPAFSVEALLGLAVPLTLTTLTGQFLAGLTILRANGFDVAARPVLTFASLVSLPAALFGGITTALASITMALGAGPEAHPDPSRRYVAGVASGGFFLLTAVFAGFIGEVMVRLPVELIALLAGLALLGAIAKGLSDMLGSGEDLQAGMLTFVTSASGIVVFGINAAFWGILVGIVAVQVTHLVHRWKGRRGA